MSSRIETSSIETGSSASNDLGPDGQRLGNRDTLPLPAAQLMRILLDELLRRTQADAVEQREYLVRLLPFRLRMAIEAQRAAQVIADVMDRIER